MQIIYTSGNYKRTVVKSIVAIVLGLVLVLWPTEVLNYVFRDVKNRDHGQTFDEAELVWDYFFSGIHAGSG